MDSSANRRLVGGGVVAITVFALAVSAVLWASGVSPALAVTGGLLAGLFAVVVVPLAVIARQVGSNADDPLVLERRIGSAVGRSATELDALAEWDERRGRLDDTTDAEWPDDE